MNNQAEQVLTQLLQRAVDGVDKAVEFSQAQIPDVVEQLLLWKAVASGVSSIAAITTLALTVIFVRWVVKDLKTEQEQKKVGNWRTFRTLKPTAFRDSDGDVSPVIIFAAFAVVAGVLTSVALFSLDWLQILIAPKLYLLEYAAELVK